jgi:hypothetical protein
MAGSAKSPDEWYLCVKCYITKEPVVVQVDEMPPHPINKKKAK